MEQLTCVLTRRFIRINDSYESHLFISALYYFLFERHVCCAHSFRAISRRSNVRLFLFFSTGSLSRVAHTCKSHRVWVHLRRSKPSTDLHHFFAEDIGLPGYYFPNYTGCSVTNGITKQEYLFIQDFSSFSRKFLNTFFFSETKARMNKFCPFFFTRFFLLA